MPVTTVSAAVHITPVAVKTFFKHYKIKGLKLTRGDAGEAATDDIFFDEGFNIVRAFIELGTNNTIESLQAFTNTHVPAPPWAAVVPITIPIPTCNAAADVLIDWFGPDDLKYVVGGHKWWQVRGLDGVDAEWITEREFLEDSDVEKTSEKKTPEKQLRWEEEMVSKMEHLETVMLYVHGGAYFWGSINSHRYQMIRYARKSHGRLFAVNYRKAPQYPWPCPLHDVIAAYLYLTRPPPNAPHKAVPPEKIVIAGDSAGAGLCVALLTVLRDLGMAQPAGAVLISPWVDLTHSFPSVMSNAGSDIIPPYGFIHKPSETWPIQTQMSHTVTATETNPPPIPGHADEVKPSPKRDRVLDAVPQEPLPQDEVPSQASMMMLADIIESSDWVEDVNTEIGRASGIQVEPRMMTETSSGRTRFTEDYEPKPPKVLMENPDDVPLELQSQIQIYATNEQLTHPLVSPLLQASLGNFCPLYILAGDGECLVDEIVYLAHKAAHPASYPLRQGALSGSERQQDNAKRFTTPTNVHLQVFDGMPHVLTVFGYTESARYAYRSIAQFVEHVTQNTTYLGNFPFPELYKEIGLGESVHDSDSEVVKIMRSKSRRGSKPGPPWFRKKSKDESSMNEKGNEDTTTPAATEPALPSRHRVGFAGGADAGIEEEDREEGTSSAPQKKSGVIMLRERVDIHGHVRPMEPPEEMPNLRIPPSQIGLIKEAPVRRWLLGQTMWDERFRRRSKKVLEKRKKLEEKAEKIIRHATGQGLVVNTGEGDAWAFGEQAGEGAPDGQDNARPMAQPQGGRKSSRSVLTTTGIIDENKRYGPLDLDDENPPPSAIAKRRDTPEALALLRKCVYHTAPVTHNTVPKRKTMEVIKAAFDPSDHPVKPPPQSASEQQVQANMIPMHGLRVWDFLVGYMVRKKAKRRAKQVAAAIGNGVSGVFNGGEST